MSKLSIHLFSKANEKIGDLSFYEAKQFVRYSLVDIDKSDSLILSLKDNMKESDIKSVLKKRKKKTDKNYINGLDRIVYGNYAFFSPEGFFMFYASAEKMLWYLHNNLADITNNNPYEFKLKFVPKGYGHYGRDNLFYLTQLKNICVVCGADGKLNADGLSRHHVVPYCYRKYMTETIKCANHHDILLLCTYHHKQYENYAAKEKANVGKMYGFDKIHAPDVDEVKLNTIKRYARTLNDYYDVIPDHRRQVLINRFESLVNQKFNKELCLTFINAKYEDKRASTFHSVVKQLDSEQKVESFILFWRKHFLEAMNPQFMPVGWKVDNPVYRKD